MRKTILVLLLLSSSTLFAGENWLYKKKTFSDGAIQIGIDGLKVDDGLREGEAKDWIAVYPKNASNAWENVIDWRWADFTPYQKGGRYHVYNGATRIEKPGEYQVRFFKNNTYKLYKAFDFKITKKSPPKPWLFSDGTYLVMKGFTMNVREAGPTDWVGIYKVGDNNSWGNMIEWTWAKKMSWDGNDAYQDMHLDATKYSANKKYEARYFLNNTYTMSTKSKPFSIDKPNNGISATGIKGTYQGGRITFLISPAGIRKFKYGAKDWVGLYRKGTSNNWNNVLTWGWVKDFEDVDKGYYMLFKKMHLQKGEYDVRYFRDNSFVTYKDSTFKVQ